MIGISKLYCGAVEAADALRYNRDSSKLPSHLLQFSADKKPVVVCNMTRPVIFAVFIVIPIPKTFVTRMN
jgi:hypothetical protein